MDAELYLKEARRMCDHYREDDTCWNCPAYMVLQPMNERCAFGVTNGELRVSESKAIEIIEKWLKKNER